MNKAVFLDRDGVINKILFRGGKLSSPYNVEEFKILPDVPEAMEILENSSLKNYTKIVAAYGRGDI